MKVFISGATGQVGYAALKKFTGAGHTVKGLVQDADAAKLVAKGGALPVIGDLMAPEPWADEVKDCDIVLSASSPYHFGEPMSIKEAHRRAETHAEMVTNLLTTATHSHIQLVILTYHVTAFGSQGDRWASEILPVDPVGYGRVIGGAYWEIERNSRRMGLPTVEVFPGWTYGTSGWFEKYLVNGMLDGGLGVVGSGENYISPVHIDDLAEAIRLIAQKKPIGERFCIVDEKPMKQKDLVAYVADRLGVRPPSNTDYSLFASEHGEVMAETLNSSVRVSNSKAMKELGFRPVYPSMREGVPGVLAALGLGPESMMSKKAVGF